MTNGQLDRINQLARKSRAEGLTEEEKREQQTLRRAYADAIKASLRAQLDEIAPRGADGAQRPKES